MMTGVISKVTVATSYLLLHRPHVVFAGNVSSVVVKKNKTLAVNLYGEV